MFDITKAEYKDGFFNIKYDLTHAKGLNSEGLILNINDVFDKVTEKNNLETYIFIPNDFELVCLEDGFIDIYYMMENVKYTNEDIKNEDIDCITGDNEVGKNLFFITFENNILTVSFPSLNAMCENGNLVNILNFGNKSIYRMLKEELDEVLSLKK